MSELPPLPPNEPGWVDPPAWTADQMRRAQTDAWNAALEDAAKVCFLMPAQWARDGYTVEASAKLISEECAAAIRQGRKG